MLEFLLDDIFRINNFHAFKNFNIALDKFILVASLGGIFGLKFNNHPFEIGWNAFATAFG